MNREQTEVCSTLVRTIVSKLHVNAEVLVLQLRYYFLQRIAITPAHANDITLNGSLHFDLRILDELYNFFGFFLGNTLLNLGTLPQTAARCRLRLAIVESLEWYASPHQF